MVDLLFFRDFAAVSISISQLDNSLKNCLFDFLGEYIILLIVFISPSIIFFD